MSLSLDQRPHGKSGRCIPARPAIALTLRFNLTVSTLGTVDMSSKLWVTHANRDVGEYTLSKKPRLFSMNSSIVRYRTAMRLGTQRGMVGSARKRSSSSYHADNKRCSGWRNNATKWPENPIGEWSCKDLAEWGPCFNVVNERTWNRSLQKGKAIKTPVYCIPLELVLGNTIIKSCKTTDPSSDLWTRHTPRPPKTYEHAVHHNAQALDYTTWGTLIQDQSDRKERHVSLKKNEQNYTVNQGSEKKTFRPKQPRNWLKFGKQPQESERSSEKKHKK